MEVPLELLSSAPFSGLAPPASPRCSVSRNDLINEAQPRHKSVQKQPFHQKVSKGGGKELMLVAGKARTHVLASVECPHAEVGELGPCLAGRVSSVSCWGQSPREGTPWLWGRCWGQAQDGQPRRDEAAVPVELSSSACHWWTRSSNTSGE